MTFKVYYRCCVCKQTRSTLGRVRGHHRLMHVDTLVSGRIVCEFCVTISYETVLQVRTGPERGTLLRSYQTP